MSNRILVTYATRTSSTAEVANAVSEVLRTRGYSVDVKSVKAKPSLEGYHGVILGSAIRMGTWLPEMLAFIRSNQTQLNRIPTAIFTVHILNTGSDDTSRAARDTYTIPVRQLINPVDEAFFAGSIDLTKLSFVDRVLTRLMVGDASPKIGDFREWDRVHAWAKEVQV
ncbi:MAG TPA: flavodoxin domain-containing protein [Anaerolineales bacterium]|nr:flavodoxin domain-containing protein [Anaerolineales bacterium]